MISTVTPTDQTIIGTQWWTNVVEATSNELISVLGRPNAGTEWHLIAKDDERNSTYIVTLYMSFPINHNERFRWHIGTKDYRQSIDFQRWLTSKLNDLQKHKRKVYVLITDSVCDYEHTTDVVVFDTLGAAQQAMFGAIQCAETDDLTLAHQDDKSCCYEEQGDYTRNHIEWTIYEQDVLPDKEEE